MCDFNINILNCYSDKDTTNFVDTINPSLLYPTLILQLELQQPQKF